MTKRRYPEKFKIEALKQLAQRSHSVADVFARIGVSKLSMYKWITAIWCLRQNGSAAYQRTPA